jgi:hypothetical protein
MKFNLDCKLIEGGALIVILSLFEIGGDLNSKDKKVGGGNNNDEKLGCQ